MRYPQALVDQVLDHPRSMEMDPVTGESTGVELRAAYSETVQAHSVIEVELDSGRSFLIHIEDVQAVLDGIKHPVDANDKLLTPIGAEVGSWCIKTLDGEPNYGMLASEDRSGRHVCRLYQSQLDRLKALAAPVFRDKTSGAILDAAAIQGIV